MSKEKSHVCPDDVRYRWKSRVSDPRSCPRCKQYLK